MYTFPTLKEWEEIYKTYPFKRLEVRVSDFDVTRIDGWDGIIQLAKEKELITWKLIQNIKWNDVSKSYVLMMFYYNMGIPDEPYYISPGRKGQSVEYFPNFEKEHFIRKDAFDYFADVFFYKVFSAIEGLWQLLNIIYDCNIKENNVSLESLRRKLTKSNKQLASCLKNVSNDDRYQAGIELRQIIAHRLPTGMQGLGLQREAKTASFSEYTSAKDVIHTAKELLDFCSEASEKICKFANTCQ
jgi:hypothetical protein